MHKSNIDKVRIEVQLPQALVAQIDLLYLDPKLGRAKYGARSDLIQRLLEQHIKELQQHASLPGATSAVTVCSRCGTQYPADRECPSSVCSPRQAVPVDCAAAGEAHASGVRPEGVRPERAGSGRDRADGGSDLAEAQRELYARSGGFIR